MLSTLKRRVARAGISERVVERLAASDSLRVADFADTVDFTLAFALVHELPAIEPFFDEVAMASKKRAGLLFVEPAGHVKPAAFQTELEAALHAGFELIDRPAIRRSHAAFLKKL